MLSVSLTSILHGAISLTSILQGASSHTENTTQRPVHRQRGYLPSRSLQTGFILMSVLTVTTKRYCGDGDFICKATAAFTGFCHIPGRRLPFTPSQAHSKLCIHSVVLSFDQKQKTKKQKQQQQQQNPNQPTNQTNKLRDAIKSNSLNNRVA